MNKGEERRFNNKELQVVRRLSVVAAAAAATIADKVVENNKDGQQVLSPHLKNLCYQPLDEEKTTSEQHQNNR